MFVKDEDVNKERIGTHDRDIWAEGVKERQLVHGSAY